MANQLYSVDRWNGCLSSLRQFLKGWGANVKGKFHKEKEVIAELLNRLDLRADENGLCAEEWLDRYKAESDLEKKIDMEEKYWQQRGDVKWIAQGDANTSYFHSCANGKRKTIYF